MFSFDICDLINPPIAAQGLPSSQETFSPSRQQDFVGDAQNDAASPRTPTSSRCFVLCKREEMQPRKCCASIMGSRESHVDGTSTPHNVHAGSGLDLITAGKIYFL